MASMYYDRIDFYKKNRDYTGLLDDDNGTKETKKETKKDTSNNVKSEKKRIFERHDYVDRREKLKALEERKLRQRFNEVYGSQANSFKQENGNQKRKLEDSGESRPKKRILANDSFGSFFGPSQPVISKRVIDQRSSKLESAHTDPKLIRNNSVKNTVRPVQEKSEYRKEPAMGMKAELKRPVGSNGKSESKMAIIASEPKAKTQRPMASKDVAVQKSASGKPAQSRPVSNVQPLAPKDSGSSRKPILLTTPNPHTKNTNKKLLPKQAIVAQGLRPNVNVKASVDSKKQVPKLSSTAGRSAQQTEFTNKIARLEKTSVVGDKTRALPSGIQSKNVERQQVSVNRPLNSVRSVPLKSSTASVHSDKKKPIVLSNSTASRQTPKMVPKVVSKEATQAAPKVPTKPVPRPPNVALRPPNATPRPQISAPKSQTKLASSVPPRPKKRPNPFDSDDDMEGGDYSSIIRKMFGYDPTKYKGMDYDDKDMEVGFSRVMAEEKRSARIAREEDERELALIEEEERRERELARKRKLMKNKR